MRDILQGTNSPYFLTNILAAVAVLGFASPAAAQSSDSGAAPSSDPVPAPASSAASTDIVVTGSRIARRDLTSDSPIVTVNPEAFGRTGAVTLEATLNYLPQLSPAAGSSSNDDLNGGISTLSLRNLGAQRTLVLMDGKRLPGADATGAVDINNIPEALIQKVEVITGGASAAYGSDAIAGVVNFAINHKFRGIRFDTQGGISERGDGASGKFALTFGTAFDDDRGNIEVSIGYAHRDAINNSARAFSNVSRASSFLPFGTFVPSGTNLPTQAAVDGVFSGYGFASGSVSATTALSINNDGSLFTTKPVHFLGGADNIVFTPGVSYNSAGNNGLVLPFNRYNAYFRADHDIGSHANVFAEFLFQQFDSSSQYAPTLTTLTVPATNPFIPSALAAVLASRPDPTASFTFKQRFAPLGFREGLFDTSDLRGVIGVTGDFAGRDWTWEVYASYARETRQETDYGGYSSAALTRLLTAPDGGKSLCAGGANIFGNNLNAACAAYIARTANSFTRITQKVIEADTQGKIIELPAGDMRFAFGADYRSDNYNFVPDSGYSSGDITGLLTSGLPAVSGTIEAREVYGELLIPVLRDLPLIKSLQLGLGYRHSDYNTSGGVDSYRADGTWKMASWVAFRGGYSRAVRAANIGELFTPEVLTSPVIGAAGALGQGDPCDVRGAYRTGSSGSQVAALCQAQGMPSSLVSSYVYTNLQLDNGGSTGGNARLKPEIADTYTVGTVLTPRLPGALRNLTASFDYYDIGIKGAIGTIDASSIIAKCYNADGSNPSYAASNVYCQLFTRDSQSGNIKGLSLFNLNLGSYHTSGIDAVIDWHSGLGALGLSDRYGSVSLNGAVTYIRDFKIQNFPGGPFTNFAGAIGNNVTYPKWKSTTTLAYSLGSFNAALQWRFIDKMIDVSAVGVANSTAGKIPSKNYFDLSFSWAVTKVAQFRFGVTNIGDVQPPVYQSFVQSNTNPSVYDPIGRSFYVGVTTKF